MDKKYWIASIATLGAIDVWAAYVKKDGTLSQAGREVFRTDTRTGRLVWAFGWGALTAWLVPHIWKNIEGSS